MLDTRSMPENKVIVLFDGVCNFCDATVLFLIDRDTKDRFRFASLQSSAGSRLLATHNLPSDYLDALVVVDGEHVFVASDAALRIARHLPWPWPLLSAFILVPRILRQAAYKRFARARYRMFGQADACRIPTPELKRKFLDDAPEPTDAENRPRSGSSYTRETPP